MTNSFNFTQVATLLVAVLPLASASVAAENTRLNFIIILAYGIYYLIGFAFFFAIVA